ncbi:hypothetical protein IMAU80100_02925 [Lactiplantibacillus plantarum]|nr:hypothetical protein [Lactiplantibacillus plantarum]MCG0644219.1 hypothetical protein [Lactiplantibacillus plantarum]MCG0647310.1 hypothetical protein [Lactiplantibacillus plantarum]MCG0653533.1 hypothetical protein [Lactiplantibacillus plantarum]MCG0786425.1 hypothetical protein [Lactiplantibacillus plantarum]
MSNKILTISVAAYNVEKTGCKLIPETTFKRGYNE